MSRMQRRGSIAVSRAQLDLLKKSSRWTEDNQDAYQDALRQRLEDKMVLELHTDGSQQYLHMSVRGLFQYCMRAITGTDFLNSNNERSTTVGLDMNEDDDENEKDDDDENDVGNEKFMEKGQVSETTVPTSDRTTAHRWKMEDTQAEKKAERAPRSLPPSSTLTTIDSMRTMSEEEMALEGHESSRGNPFKTTPVRHGTNNLRFYQQGAQEQRHPAPGNIHGQWIQRMALRKSISMSHLDLSASEFFPGGRGSELQDQNNHISQARSDVDKTNKMLVRRMALRKSVSFSHLDLSEPINDIPHQVRGDHLSQGLPLLRYTSDPQSAGRMNTDAMWARRMALKKSVSVSHLGGPSGGETRGEWLQQRHPSKFPEDSVLSGGNNMDPKWVRRMALKKSVSISHLDVVRSGSDDSAGSSLAGTVKAGNLDSHHTQHPLSVNTKRPRLNANQSQHITLKQSAFISNGAKNKEDEESSPPASSSRPDMQSSKSTAFIEEISSQWIRGSDGNQNHPKSSAALHGKENTAEANALPRKASSNDHLHQGEETSHDQNPYGPKRLPHQHTRDLRYCERIGSYLHPRDMRRLVTPLSPTNEPEIIVRRHVMLLNFDPVRAIILRDRLLILVHDGADSILVELEKRIRGGSLEMNDSFFGAPLDLEDTSVARSEQRSSLFRGGLFGRTTGGSEKDSVASGDNSTWSRLRGSFFSLHGLMGETPLFRNSITPSFLARSSSVGDGSRAGLFTKMLRRRSSDESISRKHFSSETTVTTETSDPHEDKHSSDSIHDSEWAELRGRQWTKLPFELLCTDAVLHTVIGILSNDTNELSGEALGYITDVVDRSTGLEHNTWQVIQAVRDNVKEMEGRLKRYSQSLSKVLNVDEDMALMNLSRLVTHPDRFLKPVQPDILEEEADEPQLILESYLQQSLSLQNALNLISGRVESAAELATRKLTTTENKILMMEMVVSTISLGFSCTLFVGSMMGMNLTGPNSDVYQYDFTNVLLGTISCTLVVCKLLLSYFYFIGVIPRIRTVKDEC